MTPFTRRENTEAQCRDAHTDALSVAITCLSPPIPEDAPTFIGICVPARILSEHWDVIEGFFSDKYTFGERSSRQLLISTLVLDRHDHPKPPPRLGGGEPCE